jgi:hypothetical protein
MNNSNAEIWIVAVVVLIPLSMIVLTHIAAANQVVRDFHTKKLFIVTHRPLINPVKPEHLVCPSCQRMNPVDHRFCGFCGASLKKPTNGG